MYFCVMKHEMLSTYETHTGSPSLERIFLVTVRIFST